MNGLPWIEKYRPKTIDDLVVDPSILHKIKKIIEEKNMPNIIITGIPGIGKTTTIQCIAKALFGPHLRDAVLELNASDDRGVEAIQDTITFCKKKTNYNKPGESTYATHKIILLDEADNMTIKAQRLVNNLMEEHRKTTRFAFTCNNSSDIIEAIQSRCIIFRYYRLSNDNVIKRLRHVCDIEHVPHDEESLQLVSTISQGDMRQGLNTLQLVFNTYGILNIPNIEKLYDKPHPIIIKKLFIACRDKNMQLALQYIQELRKNGYCGSDIVLSMISVLKSPGFPEIDETYKISLLGKISKTAFIISKGIDTPLQLTGCIASILLS